jgi:hypothetical protein
MAAPASVPEPDHRQDLHQTIKAAKPTGGFYNVPGGGKQFHVKVTVSDGTTWDGVITLRPDGSVAWRATGPAS